MNIIPRRRTETRTFAATDAFFRGEKKNDSNKHDDDVVRRRAAVRVSQWRAQQFQQG